VVDKILSLLFYCQQNTGLCVVNYVLNTEYKNLLH
jgi:ABC-type cobalt transport system substrate-binding protein